MVELEKVETDEDTAELRELIEKHERYTRSAVAANLLKNWDDSLAAIRQGDADGLQARIGRAAQEGRDATNGGSGVSEL